MKTLKRNSFKVVVNFALILLVLLAACSNSGSNKSVSSENAAKVKSSVEKPNVDLHTAIMSGNLEAVKQHIEAGTDINKKEQMSGSTPLIAAVSFNKTAIAKALIDAGADLNLKNNDGSTALHSAAFFCHLEIVQMLIDAKADKTLKNNYGATARESVLAPFADMKPIYQMMQQQLEPLGIKIDLAEVEKNRPVVAMMLQ
ncbi:ankyrin repeat domain-containing protein [uncultured Draconibacterium sp.]|uniref:ankyrin repeat domain-containing protein n=1 Tax=uncultured Draconibacterium sp. TaxID=1573823 RepID=UPI0025FF4A18|nr:ankyrin repeat domain-containing protein [uncultured Draconibacterium sp.]